MGNLIACRLASYGAFEERAWTHLPEIGIRHVELPAPEPSEQKAVKQRLLEHGLEASSVQARCDIGKPDAVDVMWPQLQACFELEAKICFLSVKAGDTDRTVVWDRLRAIGDAAAQLGVIVALETHPDLVTNGQIGRATMEAINHAHVRINFDTANVYFYNEGATATGELARILDYVASVHLKDTTGGYQEWNFPALGTGVVDFPEVFRMLNARGLTGPFTMELEGSKGVERNEAEQLQYVADSVEYLRRIGAF
jgi:L-ribulose-5-phosphate 3-epimerase